MGVTPITSLDQFRTVINNGKPVLIDFWATWCGPCRTISPVFEEISGKEPDIGFYKVDVDDQLEISEEVHIKAMPTFVLFKDGNKVAEVVGASRGKLEGLVAQGAGLL